MINSELLVALIDDLCQLRAQQIVCRDVMADRDGFAALEDLAPKLLLKIEQELDKLQHPASDKSKTIEG